jgi:serine/alanine adding enzyme
MRGDRAVLGVVPLALDRHIWTVRMRELGTPCYPCKLFHVIMRTFPNQSRIFLALHDGLPVAVLFTYTFKKWVQCSWGAALREYDSLGPNYLLNWAAIEYYCGQGMRWFDFGRSTKGSGQHIFKERWGAFPIELWWQYWTQPGGRLALATPTNERYRHKVEVWKKMPLWATRLIGPVISPALA